MSKLHRLEGNEDKRRSVEMREVRFYLFWWGLYRIKYAWTGCQKEHQKRI